MLTQTLCKQGFYYFSTAKTLGIKCFYFIQVALRSGHLAELCYKGRWGF